MNQSGVHGRDGATPAGNTVNSSASSHRIGTAAFLEYWARIHGFPCGALIIRAAVGFGLMTSSACAEWICFYPGSPNARWSTGLCKIDKRLQRCPETTTSETQWLEIDSVVAQPGSKQRMPERESSLSVLPSIELDGPNPEADFHSLKAEAYVSTDSTTWARWTSMKPSISRSSNERNLGKLFCNFGCWGGEKELIAKFGRFPKKLRIRIEMPPNDTSIILSVIGPMITDDNQDGVYRIKQ